MDIKSSELNGILREVISYFPSMEEIMEPDEFTLKMFKERIEAEKGREFSNFGAQSMLSRLVSNGKLTSRRVDGILGRPVVYRLNTGANRGK